jgi:hypothetical protein
VRDDLWGLGFIALGLLSVLLGLTLQFGFLLLGVGLIAYGAFRIVRSFRRA